MVFCVAADTKPTNMGTGALAWVTDTGEVFRWSGAAWILLVGGPASAETYTNKNISCATNSIVDTVIANGAILHSNGTKYVGMAIGTANQVLRTNAAAKDIEWATFNAENAGKAVASGNASTTVFNIAHGLGSNPSHVLISCSSLQPPTPIPPMQQTSLSHSQQPRLLHPIT